MLLHVLTTRWQWRSLKNIRAFRSEIRGISPESHPPAPRLSLPAHFFFNIICVFRDSTVNPFVQVTCFLCSVSALNKVTIRSLGHVGGGLPLASLLHTFKAHCVSFQQTLFFKWPVHICSPCWSIVNSMLSIHVNTVHLYIQLIYQIKYVEAGGRLFV